MRDRRGTKLETGPVDPHSRELMAKVTIFHSSNFSPANLFFLFSLNWWTAGISTLAYQFFALIH